jgi:hypothetical protein
MEGSNAEGVSCVVVGVRVRMKLQAVDRLVDLLVFSVENDAD